MSGGERDRLKLRARDTSDYEVVSAVLQDALVAIADIAHLQKERRFVLLANRFRWEARAPLADLPDGMPQPRTALSGDADARFEDAPLYERVQCGLTFDRVGGVRYRGFRRDTPGRILNMLALLPDAAGVTLQFSADAAVRLQGRRLVCHLEDIGEPWPTHWRPQHDPEHDPEHDPRHDSGHDPDAGTADAVSEQSEES